MNPKDVDRPVDQVVAAYVRMPYTRILIPDPDEGGFIAEVLELPGCLSQGETPDEAFNNLDDAMSGYIASLLDRGYSVPEPAGVKEYPGRFLLRISSELHRAAATRAMHEGVSLNQWIGQALAERLAAKSLADEVISKLRVGPLMVNLSTALALQVGQLHVAEPQSKANEPDVAATWLQHSDQLQSVVFESRDDIAKQIPAGRRARNA